MLRSLLLVGLSIISISSPVFAVPNDVIVGLMEAGVTVVANVDCSDKSGLQGSYNPHTQVITMCEGVENYKETLYHESIHALQHLIDNNPEDMGTLYGLTEFCTPMTYEEFTNWSTYQVDEFAREVEFVAWSCQNDYEVIEYMWYEYAKNN